MLLIADLIESIAGGIVDPWVVVGTAHAGLQVDGLPGNLFGRELARVGYPAGRWAFDRTLLLPGLEALGLADGAWVLDPLDHLGHRREVDVVVVLQGLIDPVQEGVQEFGIVLQPGSVEEETERRAVLLIMPIEVVRKEIVELVASQDVGARVNHSTAGQVFVVLGILTTVELVHNHFPDGVRPGTRVGFV